MLMDINIRKNKWIMTFSNKDSLAVEKNKLIKQCNKWEKSDKKGTNSDFVWLHLYEGP